MWRKATRLLGTRGKRVSLPDYSMWSFGGHAWGEALWSVLHGQPIRSNMIPERAHELFNLWGPNGRFPDSRFNTQK